jgi:hypothetical protein
MNEQEQLMKAAKILYKKHKESAGKLWYDVIFCKEANHTYTSYYCNERFNWHLLKKLKLI